MGNSRPIYDDSNMELIKKNSGSVGGKKGCVVISEPTLTLAIKKARGVGSLTQGTQGAHD